MSRPCKCRRIGFRPEVTHFKPAGIPLRHLEEVSLTIDEVEAIRLADLEGLYQEDAAIQMNISRQTFGNILNSAHHKIADALVNAKAITIQGGQYQIASRETLQCTDCQHEWHGYEDIGRIPNQCPHCQSLNIHRSVQAHAPDEVGTCEPGRRRCRRKLL